MHRARYQADVHWTTHYWSVQFCRRSYFWYCFDLEVSNVCWRRILPKCTGKLLDEAQIPLQHIVWREQPTDDIKTYELVTLTYGTASASFLATKVIQQLADLEEDQFPKGAMITRRDFYVDDLITRANSKEKALIIRNEITALLQKGNFTLRKWTSNSQDLLEDMPEASVSDAMLKFGKNEQDVKNSRSQMESFKRHTATHDLHEDVRIKITYKKVNPIQHFSNIWLAWTSGADHSKCQNYNAETLETSNWLGRILACRYLHGMDRLCYENPGTQRIQHSAQDCQFSIRYTNWTSWFLWCKRTSLRSLRLRPQ